MLSTPLNQLFEAQVELTPDAIAVDFEGKQLTYQSLNSRANQLAHYLRTLGVGPDVLVGICTERSLETIVGILGIVKAGGAYVPLDTAYPQERLAFMLEDTQTSVLLTQQRLLNSLPRHQARAICLDADWQAIAGQSEENPVNQVTPDNLAYVIYTSGSTGKPKGVLVTHRGLSNLVEAQQKLFNVQPLSRVLQFASLSFDASIWEVVMALMSGATLCLGTKDSLLPGADLIQFLRNQEISTVTLPPSVLATLPAEELPALRTIIVAGEACPPNLVARWAGEHQFFNAYGPTEVTVCATVAECTDSSKKPPIGRPISNTQVYLLDDQMQSVPVGVPGEMYIGGTGLARGYLNRPDLTAERFIPNPFSDQAGDRLYKTGDLAQYLPDGNIEFLGRIDQQVKIRGFRIELGEIEAVLSQHPDVREAVVISREDVPGDKRLVAYIVPNLTTDLPPTFIKNLRLSVTQNLPDYMVPSSFVTLNALPLTPNGKVDRRALPAPDRTRGDRSDNFVAPSTLVEEILAEIWAEVLGLDQIGIHDNFLELGGHSLLAGQVISRVRDRFQFELPLRKLFETPTVAGLAASIETAGFQQGLQILPISPAFEDRCDVLQHAAWRRARKPHLSLCASLHENLPLSFAQERLWFVDQLIPNHPFYNVPQAIRLTGSLNVTALEQSLNELIRRHEVLRTTFTKVNGQPIQVIHPAATFTLPIVNLQNLSQVEREERAWQLMTEDAQLPFDLATGPLLRATLFQMSGAEHILFLNLHHILCDDWSIGVLFKELTILYEAFCTLEPSPLPLTIQYADFALWQRQWLQGNVRSAQIDYWKEHLASLPILQLPTDRPRAAVLTYRGARQPLVLPKSLTQSLQNLSCQEGVTLFMTLLAAFQTLLSRYTQQSDIVVGSPIANRPRQDVEGLIGFFVNTLVLRTDLSGNPSFRELLARVREVALGAYAHQDLPFEKLVEELQPERDLSHQSLFQVVFALQNAPMSALEMSGLTLSHQEVYNGTTKFDLHLELSQTPEGLTGWFEYSTDLFDASTIARMANHLQTLLEGIVANPDQRLLELPLLTAAERHQLLIEWNDTETDFPKACIHQLFESQVEQTPDAVAVVFENQQLTYRELNNRANQLAHHLGTLGVGPDVMVGICVERSLDMIVGILGILKAGGAYVPFDPKWPMERIQMILSSLDLHCIVTQYSRLRDIHDLQWKLPRLTDVVCLDVKTPKPSPEPLDLEAVCSLWDHVAERAVDRVTAGGFINSYTGKPFSEAEVDEYRNHVVKLAEPYLGDDKRVLEIGCGSGLLMFAIAPQVDFYLGLDPSEVTQARNRAYALELGYSNIEIQTGFAHEIAHAEANSFDLIILASTVQFFPGPIYLQQVIEQALQLLAPGGVILVADVLNPRRKDDFIQSLEEFRTQHLNESNIKTKTRLGSELYLDADLFGDLQAQLSIADVKIIHREQGFANELGYRYDVILKKADSVGISDRLASPMQRQKRLWTSWHLEQLSESNLSTSVTSSDVAYVIHTSGSTGVPKGVVVRHQSAVNLIDWVNKKFQVGSSDRILFTTSLCFDLSVYDIFGMLAAGGSIHVAAQSDLQEPKRLVNLLCHEPITFWDSAPAALMQLVPFFPSTDSNTSSQLRLIFLSGDWIPLTLPDSLRATFPAALVIGLGGATEATIWSNYYPLAKVEPPWVSIPYGKPIQNAQYYILDSNLNPCPIGVCGDLYIGGVCLADGYTDPVQTAEKFIPNPFSSKPGSRLYKTGDLARYLNDGNIEFLGRIDQQVKIRGFRIELGEVEAVLGKHSAVQEVVVMVREDLPGDKRMVAYIMPKQDSVASISELRHFLKARLPNYMVPSAFVMLDALPLTPNGKLDRRALPKPDCIRPELEETFVAPSTPVEEQMANIWAKLLGVEKVGINDNFFELGGSSLLATQLIADVRETFQVELPVRCLFENPTVERLVQTIQVLDREGLAALTTAIDLKAEAVLDAEIYPSGTQVDLVSEPRNIFLTGATGFLGAFLIHELVQQTQAKIHCLVRCRDAQEGLKKLQRNLEKYLLWEPSLSSRIIPIPGNLEQPLLGLSLEEFERLAHQIDIIYHSGAQVSFVKPYSVLKAANVLGTQEVLRLACRGKVKPVHYMSTAAVFGTIGYFTGLEVIREESDIDCSEDHLYMGYTQSKWVAEKLVWIAKSRGLPVSIFRLGFLLGHTQTGVTNTDDFLSRLIKGCIQLGSFPSLDSTEYFIPVDYASKAVVHLSKQKETLGKAFHIVNPQHVHVVQFFDSLRSYGYQLKKLPYSQWTDELIQHTRHQENELYPLLPLLTEKVSPKQLTVPELYEKNPYYDSKNTRDGLAGTSIVCPPLDAKLLDTCLSYFISSGFINPLQSDSELRSSITCIRSIEKEAA